MPKKNDVGEMKERLARLNERAKSEEDELKKLEERRKKVQNLIADVERKSVLTIYMGLEVLYTNILEMIFRKKNLRKCWIFFLLLTRFRNLLPWKRKNVSCEIIRLLRLLKTSRISM